MSKKDEAPTIDEGDTHPDEGQGPADDKELYESLDKEED